jgi:hypothetical protein
MQSKTCLLIIATCAAITYPVKVIRSVRLQFSIRYAASSGGPLRVSVIGGNHALESGDKKDSAFTKQNAANIDLAVQISTDFIKALVR